MYTHYWQTADDQTLSVFFYCEHGMVGGAKEADLSISETVDLLGFSHANISRVYRELLSLWR